MGIQSSKVLHAAKDVQSDESLPTTPILTPKVKILDNDPRSPSANIARTPIPILSHMSDNEPGTPIVGVIHSEDQDNSSVNIDPRSPAVEFVRTPIVVGNQPITIRNKNLDKVRQKLVNSSPKISSDSLNRSKGPKLIGISPAIIKKIGQSEKRKSYIGVLETDLDFVETDIDQASKLNKTVVITEKELTFEKTEFISENISLISEDNSLRSEELNEQSEIDEPKEKKGKTEIIEEAEFSPNVTPPNIEEEIEHLTTDDIISPIQQTLERISQIDQEIKEIITCSSTVVDLDEEAESKEFDKKVSSLIYEDQEVVKLISKAILSKNENRTPLSERNLNQNNKKAASKLKVHDKPRKIDYAVSKIPVFKDKKGKSKITLQCENTPPRQKIDAKQRKTQWDQDKTLII